MGEECRVADYFMVVGLPKEPELLTDSTDIPHFKSSAVKEPITDITVVFPSLGEKCPEGFEFLEKTPTGGLADLNHGSVHSPEVFICFRRGLDKPPLVDVGVFYENKERVLEECKVVLYTPYDRVANVNNTSANIFLTYRRAPVDMAANELVVTDICVINESKGEKPPPVFCIIKKNLSKGMLSSNMYLCYKKSVHRPNLISYRPEVLSRYPLVDHTDFPLEPHVPMFCMPMGASLEVWHPKASQPEITFSTFVLTVADVKVYGAAVTFYEDYPRDQLTDEQKEMLQQSMAKTERKKSVGSRINLDSPKVSLHVNKCICILSHCSFFYCYERFLKFLYSMSNKGPHNVPIERYISHLLEDVPFPSPQRPRILIQLSAEERLILAQPEDLPLPKSGANFLDLLANLCVEDVLLVLLLVLTEQKILVHSLRASVLTAVVEAISMIAFPFKWQCPYIPLCPLSLSEYLHAPMSYLIGVDSRFFDLYEVPSDVICIDLDTNVINKPEEKSGLSHKLLPKRPTRVLRTTLDYLVMKYAEQKGFSDLAVENNDDAITFQAKEKEQRLQLEIQEAFLRFTASILRGYRGFLQPITRPPTDRATDTKSLFDLAGFLKSRDRTYIKFYNMMTSTQMFIRFIEERSFVSDMDAGLAFFDECIEKVEVDDASCRLLEVDDAHKSERTVFIPPPEPTGLPEGVTYSYQGFVLNRALFKHVEHISRLQVPTSTVIPGSPIARRTKHEVKSARKIARHFRTQSERHWAQHVLTTCFSIWFIHLPSYVSIDDEKAGACLKTAYDILVALHKIKVPLTDEVCYRVMMQLCGIHGQPGTAVKLLLQMKKSGIQPNALTYGYYNRAVLEAKWPQEQASSRLLWNKLRNVTLAVSYLRQLKLDKEGSSDSVPIAGSSTSLASLDLNERMQGKEQFTEFDKHCSRVGSLVKPTKFHRHPHLNAGVSTAAGILMTPQTRHSSATELRSQGMRRSSCTEFMGLSEVSSRAPDAKCRRGSLSPIHGEFKSPIINFANDSSIVEKHNRAKNQSDGKKGGLLAGLEITRESSESLDQSDTSTGRPRILGCSSLPPKSSKWLRASQDSVASDLSGQDETTVKRRPMDEPPWSSSEVLPISDHSEVDRLRLQKRAVSESLDGKRDVDQSDYFTARRDDRSGSEDLLCASDNSSIADLSIELIKLDDKDKVNGSLQSVSEGSERLPSGPVSPIRTPVTENDPLGALQAGLDENDLTITNSEDAKNLLNKSGLPGILSSTPQDTPVSAIRKRSRIEGCIDVGVELFKSFSDNSSKKTSTIDEDGKKVMQRSSTLPNSVSDVVPVVSSPSFSNLMNKISRMSPDRLSFKKPELKWSFEQALSGSKKNEFLQYGMSSVKSAANRVAKKLEEVISTNTTPIKSQNYPQDLGVDDLDSSDRSALTEFDKWSNLFGDMSRKSSTTIAGDHLVSDQALRAALYEKVKTYKGPYALTILMTTACRCTNCSAILQNEEIIAGWTSDDSNLNTKCHFCGVVTLPFLTVTIYDYRHNDKMSTRGSSLSLGKGVGSSCSELFKPTAPSEEDAIVKKPISVPYLNPLVLRKELENILQHKGDPSLVRPSFVDQHPIIYWNMVWWFERILVPSHLPWLLLQSNTLSEDHTVTIHPSWEDNQDYRTVNVIGIWDNPQLNEEVGQPLYMLWQQKEEQSSLVNALVTDRNAVSRRDLAKVINYLKMDNMREPMLLLLKERSKQTKKSGNTSKTTNNKLPYRSLYREILYLALVAFGRSLLDIEAFEREYTSEYEKLKSEGFLLQKCDKPPDDTPYIEEVYVRVLRWPTPKT